MLGLRELGMYCRDVVRQHLSISNVLEVYEVAFFYNDMILQREAIKYCVKNYEDIKFQEKYKSLDQKVKNEIETTFNKKQQQQSKKLRK